MLENASSNIFWHQGSISRRHRETLNGHSGLTIWFTGFSASGKSTLAVALESLLYSKGCRTYILDGDNVRHGLNKNLGFSPEDRSENIRRVGEVAKLFTDCGIITLTAFISPYREDRELVRSLFRKGDFIEVYVNCPLSVCEQRDPKGIYRKARAGEIPSFTGISAPYETPLTPDIRIDTDQIPVDACARELFEFLEDQGYIPNCPTVPDIAISNS